MRLSFGERCSAPVRTAKFAAAGRRSIPGLIGKLVLLATLSISGSAFGQGEDEVFERYLARLGLRGLQAAHLEQQLEQQTSESARQATARKLADVYAGQLLANAEDQDRYARTMRSIQRLIQRVPQAKTPSLEVMLLQADYFVAEKHITDWLAGQTDTAARDQALQILGRITPQLHSHQANLAQQVEELINRIDGLPTGPELEEAEAALAQVEPVAGRAMYFAATSSYYLALLSQTAETQQFATSRDLFRKLLGIDGAYEEFDPSFLGLASTWRCRALIGLALAEAALGNHAASRLCFSWLSDTSVPGQMRDEVPYWRLQALLNSEQFESLLKYAREQVAAYTGAKSRGRLSFCVGLVRAGFGRLADVPQGRDIGMAGLAGLIKLGGNATAADLLEEFQISIDEDAGFYLKWVKGQQLFERATSTKSKADYEAAIEMLSAAIEAPDAGRDVHAISKCRSQLASCYYATGEKEQAARQFEQAADGLRAAGDELAAQTAWNAFVAYQTLAKDQPRFIASATNVLTRIKRDYPDSQFAEDADYQIGRLKQRNLTPEELLELWEKVPRDSASYLSARYDICRVRYQMWSQAGDADKPAAATQVLESAKTFLAAAARTSGDPSQQVRVCLWVVYVALQDPRDDTTAQEYLAQARGLAGRLPARSELATEYRVRELQLGPQDNFAKHESWILENPNGSPSERTALALLVKSRERALKTATGPQRTAHLERLVSLVERLGLLLANRPDQATIANSKLARYAAALGQHGRAAEILDRLLATPGKSKNKDYLRRAAKAHYQAQNFEDALTHWRTLVLGLKRGSDEWYEAKYYQLSSLKRVNAAQFRRAADQFRLLYPKLGPAAWRDRFRDLLGG